VPTSIPTSENKVDNWDSDDGPCPVRNLSEPHRGVEAAGHGIPSWSGGTSTTWRWGTTAGYDTSPSGATGPRGAVATGSLTGAVGECLLPLPLEAGSG